MMGLGRGGVGFLTGMSAAEEEVLEIARYREVSKRWARASCSCSSVFTCCPCFCCCSSGLVRSSNSTYSSNLISFSSSWSSSLCVKSIISISF